jgi:hypothetical protein
LSTDLVEASASKKSAFFRIQICVDPSDSYSSPYLDDEV